MSQALWHTLTALAVTVGIATAGCQPPIEDEDEDDDVQEPDPIWDGFVDERDEHLAALASGATDARDLFQRGQLRIDGDIHLAHNLDFLDGLA